MVEAVAVGVPSDPVPDRQQAAEAEAEAVALREAELARRLVTRIRAGDRTAESELVETYSRGLLFYLRHRCGDPALADDLHQETFQVVLIRLREKGLDDPSRVAGFLRRTARNLLLAGHRKHRRRQTETDDEAVHAEPDRSKDPLDQTLLAESVRIVRGVIADLPNARDRRLLYRFYIAEEDKDTICEALGIAPPHMKRVLFRARQRFKDKLEQVEGRRQRHLDRGPPASPPLPFTEPAAPLAGETP